MKPLFYSLLTFGMLFPAATIAASTDTSELESRMQQLERRIDHLEQVVEDLQSNLLDAQSGEPVDVGSSRAPERQAGDPLVGSWECTNQVFTYDISFYADGRIIQEEPFFSTAKSGRWSRLNEDRFVTDQGRTFQVEFDSDDDVSVTNLNSQEVWECERTSSTE